MQNYLIWIVIGGLIGLAASFVMHTYANPGLRVNVILGIAGAVLAGLLLAPLLHVSAFNPPVFSYPAMMVAILGALLLVPVAHLLRTAVQAAVRHE